MQDFNQNNELTQPVGFKNKKICVNFKLLIINFYNFNN